ncbi:MAG: beta/gamma crystallin-related protein [Nostoc sp.]|uniref:beta/gamma crystallin-related protein n=1 Tax=Nostoc sp. TaxID=1180 RepID=UPI002FFC09BF
MSNINNNGVDMNNQTLAQLNLSAVKELNDEVAASCSGGGGVGGPDPDVILFQDADLQGANLGLNAKTGEGVDVGLDNQGHDSGFNDRTSSIKILRGRWNFFNDANFQGGSSTGILGPGSYSTIGARSNDSITSAFRVGA